MKLTPLKKRPSELHETAKLQHIAFPMGTRAMSANPGKIVTHWINR